MRTSTARHDLGKDSATPPAGAATPEAPTTDRDYAYYQRALAGQRLPLAFIDLDLLDANARALTARAAGMPMRLATKSLRCVWVIRYLLQHYPGFRGLMPFSPAEAVYLAGHGLDDMLIGYPTLEASEIKPCLELLRQGRRITFMVDAPEHVHLLAELGRSLTPKLPGKIPVCLDLDLSSSYPGLHFGVYRSPITSPRSAEALLAAIAKTPQIELRGLMGYEAQLAGIADNLPHQWAYSQVVRLLKHLSQQEVERRRGQMVAALKHRGYNLAFVNGGGTGSIETTRGDASVTELTVGSGLYSPTLFDHYLSFHHHPAAGFALPVVRAPKPGIYACSGGGYIASGPTHADKQPQPYLPPGISLIKTLGGGEVQTSLRSPVTLELGEPVFFRHAKAGELCERFNHVHLLRGGLVEAVVPTYRGDGQCFF